MLTSHWKDVHNQNEYTRMSVCVCVFLLYKTIGELSAVGSLKMESIILHKCARGTVAFASIVSIVYTEPK